MIKQKNILLLLALFFLVSLTACAPEGHTYKEYGFFSGIWHGICMPFALVGKLFGSDIGLYAENNTGFFYWLGIFFGLSLIGGGSSGARRY